MDEQWLCPVSGELCYVEDCRHGGCERSGLDVLVLCVECGEPDESASDPPLCRVCSARLEFRGAHGRARG